MHNWHCLRQGLFGKVMADLIAEGQSDSAILQELYEPHILSKMESLC